MEQYINIIKHLVDLAEHLAWPGTILLAVLIARRQLRSLIEALAARIRDPRSNLAISKEGLEIKTQLEAKVESLEVDQEQTKSLTLNALGLCDDTGTHPQSDETSLDQELIKLADDYLAISSPDWAERIREKNAVARKMGDFVITKGVSRDLLARQHHEGLLLALAVTIHTLPQSDDSRRLLTVASRVGRIHVKYQVCLAMSRLIERQIIDDSETEQVRTVVKFYKRGADESLMKRLHYIEELING